MNADKCFMYVKTKWVLVISTTCKMPQNNLDGFYFFFLFLLQIPTKLKMKEVDRFLSYRHLRYIS